MRKLTKRIVEWIREECKKANVTTAVLGISGGKDSSVAAALCAEALGKKNVIGVMMPNGEQKDISDSQKVCKHLGIRHCTVDIRDGYVGLSTAVMKGMSELGMDISRRAQINLPPKLRTATLYMFVHSLAEEIHGFVVNTTNKDEGLMGYGTLWGDTVGDIAPLWNLHVSQVIETGLDLGLPEWAVVKPPADGLTGKTDEDSFGFTYAEVESMYNKWTDHRSHEFTENEKKAHKRMVSYEWKRGLLCGMNSFDPYANPEDLPFDEDGKPTEQGKTLEERVAELEKTVKEHVNDYAKHQGTIINVPAPTNPQPNIPWTAPNPYSPYKYPCDPPYPNPIITWCNAGTDITVKGENGTGGFVCQTNCQKTEVPPVNWQEPNNKSYTVKCMRDEAKDACLAKMNCNAQTNVDNKPKA